MEELRISTFEVTNRLHRLLEGDDVEVGHRNDTIRRILTCAVSKYVSYLGVREILYKHGIPRTRFDAYLNAITELSSDLHAVDQSLYGTGQFISSVEVNSTDNYVRVIVTDALSNPVTYMKGWMEENDEYVKNAGVSKILTEVTSAMEFDYGVQEEYFSRIGSRQGR